MADEALVLPIEHLYPVCILQDRYGGTYSNGEWLAIAVADETDTATRDTRIGWCMRHGPGGDDGSAMAFWWSDNTPGWIAVGSTPEKAISTLTTKVACQKALVHSYEIIEDGKAIRFQPCGVVSHHPEDVTRRYCGRCHRFIEDVMAEELLARSP